ncbi:MAG: UDP-N-acetylmuramate dehydrogenase [bacterium]
MMAGREYINQMKRMLGPRFRQKHPLAPLTSLKIGGNAEFYVTVNDLDELHKVVTMTRSEGMKIRILGRGTDLVVQDGLLKGMIIRLGGTLMEIKRNNDRIGMGAGCPLSYLLREAITFSLDGVEPLAGIPGTLGGAITLNAGTEQGSLGDLVEEVDILEGGRIETWRAEEAGFTYRGSNIKNGHIVLGARLRLKPGLEVKAAVKSALLKRWAIQPHGERSAGCVFRNPEGEHAGRLIDETGLKGERVGDIEVSKKHANFFINLGKGSMKDFVRLMDLVQKKVYERFGVTLEPEVRFWVNGAGDE